MKKPLRSFLALWPDDALRSELAARATVVAKASGGRAPRPDAIHLTLVFVGATPAERVDALCEVMESASVPAFTIRFDRLGWFRHNRVAWAGVHAPPEPLLDLQRALARGASRIGFSLDVRPYVPHLTLARDTQRPPPTGAFAPLEWRAESFVLVSSELLPEGPRYRIMHERPLETEVPSTPATPLAEGQATARPTGALQ